METFTIHSRYRTSEYDEGGLSGGLLDEDPIEGAHRAFNWLCPNLNHYARSGQKIDPEEASHVLELELVRIARNFWADLDFDTRSRAADVKGRAKAVAPTLRKLAKLLDESPPFFKSAIRAELKKVADPHFHDYDLYALTATLTQDMLSACSHFTSRTYKKGGEAVRFVNACRDLVSLWEKIFGRKFPRNIKTVVAHDRDRRRGIDKSFEGSAAQFVFDALHQIAREWPTINQVEEGLRAVFKER